MDLKKEKKKIAKFSKRLFKYLRRNLMYFLQILHLKLIDLKGYFVKFYQNKAFRKDEIAKFNENLQKRVKIARKKIRVEAKIILNRKFEEESRNIARKPIVVGMWAVLLLFGSFMLWAVTAKVDSTAIAIGKIVVDSNKKIVQHLEGGIIEEIFVKNGDKVKAGQQLVRLSETSAKANQELLNKQLFALKATKIRLTAERDGRKLLNYVDFAIAKEYEDDKELIKILDGELELFYIRKKSLDEKVNILLQKKRQLKKEISGLNSQKYAAKRRLDMLTEEAKSLDKLYADRIISRSRYLELKKQKVELEGNKGQYEANISKVLQAISETDLEIANFKTEKLNEILKELQEIQTKIADLLERTSASSDVLTRTMIIAPVAGIVNDLHFHTQGGVITPGAEILEIIPQDKELIVEARINPQDIDVVRVGLDARVRLSAYKSKAVPMLKGEVINVSADSFEDQQSGLSFFIARIKIDNKEMSRLEEGVRLYPGMPAETYIVSGSRTFMQYLFDPIKISMRRAFRED